MASCKRDANKNGRWRVRGRRRVETYDLGASLDVADTEQRRRTRQQEPSSGPCTRTLWGSPRRFICVRDETSWIRAIHANPPTTPAAGKNGCPVVRLVVACPDVTTSCHRPRCRYASVMHRSGVTTTSSSRRWAANREVPRTSRPPRRRPRSVPRHVRPPRSMDVAGLRLDTAGRTTSRCKPEVKWRSTDLRLRPRKTSVAGGRRKRKSDGGHRRHWLRGAWRPPIASHTLAEWTPPMSA